MCTSRTDSQVEAWLSAMTLDEKIALVAGTGFDTVGVARLHIPALRMTDVTGTRRGAEVVQLYVHAASAAVARPEQELRAFAKIDLAPGEEREVTWRLPVRAFAYFDANRPERDAWRTDPGTFEIRAGSSSRDIRLRTTMTVPTK
jgi:hypothetical protein